MSSSRCARTAYSRWESCSSSPPRSARPEAGPSTIATATARLRRTTGLPVKDSNLAYAFAISAQRVEAYETASSLGAAIEAQLPGGQPGQWLWRRWQRPLPLTGLTVTGRGGHLEPVRQLSNVRDRKNVV